MIRRGPRLWAILTCCALGACGTDDTRPGDTCTDCDVELLDGDGDGFTRAEGDCDDQDGSVNPQALEDLGPSGAGDGVDDDCDGATDETDPCLCSESIGTDPAALDCATEIACDPRFVVATGTVSSPTDDYPSDSIEALAHFGDAANALAPLRGNSYVHLTTGVVGTGPRSTQLPGDGSLPDPFGSPTDTMFDVVEYSVELLAPQNAVGFAVEYIFFSVEYDEYVNSGYNDKFYITVRTTEPDGSPERVVNYTECRDPSNYHDFDQDNGCDLPSGYCCYIAINSALSECCWFNCPGGSVATNIDGTGYQCATSQAVDSAFKGSSTGWLQTQAPVSPGQAFTLTFHIHDTHDQGFDSAVLIDNFRWLTVEIQGGTAPI